MRKIIYVYYDAFRGRLGIYILKYFLFSYGEFFKLFKACFYKAIKSSVNKTKRLSLIESLNHLSNFNLLSIFLGSKSLIYLKLIKR